MKESSPFSLSEELGSADFNDSRLTTRLKKISNQISAAPSKSLPEAAVSVASLEATYRFFGNPRVKPEKILKPHFEATRARASQASRLIVPHDKSELILGGESRKEAIGSSHQDNLGFVGLFSLALCRTDVVRPLGVIGIETFFNYDDGKIKKKHKINSVGRVCPLRRALTWGNSVKNVNHRLSGLSPIHVIDREGDVYELADNLIQNSTRFVIRASHNRDSKNSDGETTKLHDLLNGLPIICRREVNISQRPKSNLPGNNRTNPPRLQREAKLQITATTVEIKRPKSAHRDCSKTIILNYVHVYEVDAPSDAEPVDWKLHTSEPILSEEDVLNIVDDYRARWMIEEYFKALKTGCAYEKRQLESRESLLNALAVFAAVAWQLLLLRSLSRHSPEVSAEQALTKTQLEVLQAVANKKLSNAPTVGEAFLAIAALGGHIPNNGAPGWMVLSRGMEKLLIMVVAWEAALTKPLQRCDQS